MTDLDAPDVRDGIERARGALEGDAQIAGALGLLRGGAGGGRDDETGDEQGELHEPPGVGAWVR